MERGGGGRDERAADLPLLVLNYILEKAGRKRQEAQPGLQSVWSGAAFPFFIPFFLSRCVKELGKQHPHPLPGTPVPQRGGPRMGVPVLGGIHGVGIQVIWSQNGDTGSQVVLRDRQLGRSCPGEVAGGGVWC